MSKENLFINLIDRKSKDNGKIYNIELLDEVSEDNITNISSYKDVEKLLQTNLTKFNDIYLNIEYLPDDYIEIINALKNNIKYCNFKDIENEKIIGIIKSNLLNDRTNYRTKYNYYDYVNGDKVIDMLNYVNNIKKYVKHFNLSKIETAMFVYDLTRERTYKATTSNNISKSRSLSEVYNSEEIVCAGFSQIYSAILNELGIKTDTVIYNHINESKHTSHMSNIIYINDNKYDISGVYETDVTWGSKKKENNSFLNSYETFMNSIIFAIKYKQLSDLEPSKYQGIMGIYERLIKLREMQVPLFVEKNESLFFAKKSIEIFGNLNQNDKVEKCKQIKKYLEKGTNITEDDINKVIAQLNSILSKEIDKSKFIDILYQVRRVEHSIDHEKYPLNVDLIESIVKDKYPERKEERLLKAIFYDESEIEILKQQERQKLINEIEQNKNVSNIKNNNKIDTDIKRMELISALRQMSGDNKKENPVMPKRSK